MKHELTAASVAASPTLARIDRDLFGEIEVQLEARLGRATLPIADVLGLKAGATVKLETRLADPVDVYLNGALIARGEIVAVDDSFGIRLLEIADRE